MAMLDFNANEVAPLAPLEPIPAGKYEAVIVESDMKPNKANTGSYLEIKAEVISGEHAGHRITTRLNLVNPNPKAVAMARAELSSICHATGVMTPRDSSELHNIPVIVNVTEVNRPDGGGKSNEIHGWESKNAAPGTPVRAANQAAQTAQTTSPWQR